MRGGAICRDGPLCDICAAATFIAASTSSARLLHLFDDGLDNQLRGGKPRRLGLAGATLRYQRFIWIRWREASIVSVGFKARFGVSSTGNKKRAVGPGNLPATDASKERCPLVPIGELQCLGLR